MMKNFREVHVECCQTCRHLSITQYSGGFRRCNHDDNSPVTVVVCAEPVVTCDINLLTNPLYTCCDEWDGHDD